LPYLYVIDAYEKGSKYRQVQLHQLEAPTSLLSSLFANANRDPKKQKTPYKMEDFFLYQSREEQNVPMSVYGAAAMQLIKDRKFPQWALSFYGDLKRSASGDPPELLAYSHKNAIMLAPTIEDGELKGMLICEDVVSEKVIEMKSNLGDKILVKVHKLIIRYSAQEGVALQIIGQE
jgi:hypothetical protein